MPFTVFGQRYYKYDPILDSKTGEVIDDGSPKKVKLTECNDERVAKVFADNVKNSVPKKSWKIWIE